MPFIAGTVLNGDAALFDLVLFIASSIRANC